MKKIRKSSVFFAGMFLSVSLLASTAFAANYTVQKNDTLGKISTLFNTSVSTVMADNKLSGTVIYPNEVLYVKADTYTVKSGDSLYLISKKFGITLESLRKANNLWTDMIYPGRILTIPPPGSASVTSSNSAAAISFTSSDVGLLARLITAEADSQPYNAKVAVGAVVVNRVKSSEFPNTISGVIYQVINGYYQFTPVKNGLINKPASSDAIKAAYAALYGSDPSNGALFYFDDSATNSWLWSKPIKAEIGRMVYVY